MNGQRDIEQLRLDGGRPIAVFLLDYHEKTPWHVVDQLRAGAIPALHITDEDPALADCRFLTGIPVHLVCDDSPRAAAWVDRLLLDGVPHIIQATQGEVYVWRQ